MKSCYKQIAVQIFKHKLMIAECSKLRFKWIACRFADSAVFHELKRVVYRDEESRQKPFALHIDLTSEFADDAETCERVGCFLSHLIRGQ